MIVYSFGVYYAHWDFPELGRFAVNDLAVSKFISIFLCLSQIVHKDLMHN